MNLKFSRIVLVLMIAFAVMSYATPSTSGQNSNNPRAKANAGWEWVFGSGYERVSRHYPVEVSYRSYSSHPEYAVISPRYENYGYEIYDADGNLVTIVIDDRTTGVCNNSDQVYVRKLIMSNCYRENHYDILSASPSMKKEIRDHINDDVHYLPYSYGEGGKWEQQVVSDWEKEHGVEILFLKPTEINRFSPTEIEYVYRDSKNEPILTVLSEYTQTEPFECNKHSYFTVHSHTFGPTDFISRKNEPSLGREIWSCYFNPEELKAKGYQLVNGLWCNPYTKITVSQVTHPDNPNQYYVVVHFPNVSEAKNFFKAFYSLIDFENVDKNGTSLIDKYVTHYNNFNLSAEIDGSQVIIGNL